jgi:DNA-binding GntR family transcriptional regulator
MARRLSRIPAQSLRDRVLEAIRDALIRGEFKPGEKVPEQELAEQLGVSRTPVREALQVLEYQGLVQTRPKNGTYIADVRPEDVRDALIVRSTLEELAVRLLSERPTVDRARVCDGLQDLLDGMQQAVDRGDQVGATEFDIRWHEQLVDGAGNRQLSLAWRTTGGPSLIWAPELAEYPLTAEDWIGALDSHSTLLAILRDTDVEASVAAVRAHILRTDRV